MTRHSKAAVLHSRMDRLFGPGAFCEEAAQQRSQSELSAVLYGVLVGLLVIAVLTIAAAGVLV